MNFLDPAFLFCFVPLSLLAFASAGRMFGPSGACAVMLAATLAFCLPYGWPFVAVVIISAILNQYVFFALVDSAAPERHAQRKRWFLIGLLFNFGILIALKYGEIFSLLPGVAAKARLVASAIPVTISFFTFQRSVLLFDAYQKRPEAIEFARRTTSDQIRLGAFNLMFPNIVIGPIAYLSELAPQLQRSTFGRLNIADLRTGLIIMTIGLAKKILLADPLNSFAVVPIFRAVHSGQVVLPAEALIGILAFTAQLYFDFSGYSDIAIGLARLFGVELPINFNSPLRASGVMDFWKRWHITLTRVLARLLFTPLSVTGTRIAMQRGMRGAGFRAVASWIPLIVNFSVIGLWHGARLTYLVFGLFHCVWFIIESEVRSSRTWKTFAKQSPAALRLRLGQLIAFPLLVLSFAIFRSDSLGDFVHLMASLGGNWHSTAGELINRNQAGHILVEAFAIIWICPNTFEFLFNLSPGISTWTLPSSTPRWARLAWSPSLVWASLALILGFVVVGSIKGPTPFDYGGF